MLGKEEDIVGHTGNRKAKRQLTNLEVLTTKKLFFFSLFTPHFFSFRKLESFFTSQFIAHQFTKGIQEINGQGENNSRILFSSYV